MDLRFEDERAQQAYEDLLQLREDAKKDVAKGEAHNHAVGALYKAQGILTENFEYEEVRE